MLFVARIFGVIVLGFGLAALFHPPLFKQWLTVWEQGNRLYIAILLRFVAGIAIVVSASETRMPTLMWIVGAFLTLSVIVALVMGSGRLHSAAKWWAEQSNTLVRMWSLVAIALGTLIVYASG